MHPPDAPQSLVEVADQVLVRFAAHEVDPRIRFIPPSERLSWRLSVSVGEESEDWVFGRHGSSSIGIIPSHQEEVSIDLAADYVLMSLGYLDEGRWWQKFYEEERVQRLARRTARRQRWRRRLRLG